MTIVGVPEAPRLFGDVGDDQGHDFGKNFGLLSREKIQLLVRRHMIYGKDVIDDAQVQPASLDLRLGAKAYRVRASFLPGENRLVQDQLDELSSDEISLEGNGAVLERGCVYVVPLLERLALTDSFSAFANPKSSTGRLDIFTRLIADRAEVFDQVPRGYAGALYAEISPRSFSVRVRKGSRLNQIRFRRWNSQQFAHTEFSLNDKELRAAHDRLRLVDGELNVRNGLILRIGLSQASMGSVIGYRAQKHTDPIDVDKVGGYRQQDFWEPIAARSDARLILDPGEFYILASSEKLHVPPDLAAEMVAIDPAMGEFRVHYAGFFDPGFGYTETGHPGSRAVLEVRSHEVPFILEDGQIIGRLVYERMAEAPRLLYGQGGNSNYQGQGLKLSKHFQAA